MVWKECYINMVLLYLFTPNTGVPNPNSRGCCGGNAGGRGGGL